jgi:glycerol-3-phosphate dehydrogenase (NAD(P)+)
VSEIAVIGAGAWGTAIAIALGRSGRHRVRLWAYEREVAESLRHDYVNHLFLPGFKVPKAVVGTSSLEQALAGAEMAVTVMPSHHCRRVYEQMASHLAPPMMLLSATKGIENQTLLRMTEVASEVLAKARPDAKPRLGALSGPSFAKEVARGDPTAVAVASQDAELAAYAQQAFNDSNFRVYASEDVVGVEMGGALKNIIAIAAGVCDGIGLGHNTIAALITRGLAEITRLAVACGARRETMFGLSGVGDLVLTCTGGLSRNRSVGVELGRGRKLDDIVAGMQGMVAEGVLTLNAARGLARRQGVEMPITEQMHAVLYEGKAPMAAIHELMTRPARGEWGAGNT